MSRLEVKALLLKILDELEKLEHRVIFLETHLFRDPLIKFSREDWARYDEKIFDSHRKYKEIKRRLELRT